MIDFPNTTDDEAPVYDPANDPCAYYDRGWQYRSDDYEPDPDSDYYRSGGR